MVSNTGTKRPHFVPVCYLRAWADAGDKVAARRRDATEAFTPNVINVAVDAGIYGRGDVAQAREKMASLRKCGLIFAPH